MQDQTDLLNQIAKLLRYYSLVSTTAAGSGHPTSCLSAADVIAGLLAGEYFRFLPDQPEFANNDRLIFSKGHAAPLFYAFWAVAGQVTETELITLRQFESPLEGHPTRRFRFTELATGSLGQGLSAGIGMALDAKMAGLDYRTFVLLGDSEMAEGQVWEAMELAGFYHLPNLIAVVDVNRLGQRGETMLGHNWEIYSQRAKAFGWGTIEINGHDAAEILSAYQQAVEASGPVMIIAQTYKGKGVSFLEDKPNWHGKALSQAELEKALAELGEVDKQLRVKLPQPEQKQADEPDDTQEIDEPEQLKIAFQPGEQMATRKVYGAALVELWNDYPNLVVLDAEVSNSTYSGIFAQVHPQHFWEMYIAEQNMVSVAGGLARRGRLPFVSTFAAFFARAFDQIRMNALSQLHVVYVGSHAGVSIGEDGSSQMGLEDLAMFRAIPESVVLYPSDANAMVAAVRLAAEQSASVYIRTSRPATPVIYPADEVFAVGQAKVLNESEQDVVTVVSAGVPLFEVIKAYEKLVKENIYIRVIDLFSIKPIDEITLRLAAEQTKAVIVVEDHYPAGGMGEAVSTALATVSVPVYCRAVEKTPRSGSASELYAYEGLDADSIVALVKQVIDETK